MTRVNRIRANSAVSRARRRVATRPSPAITAPDPVSNILSNWMLQRARERNARADRIIAEIDGYLTDPVTVNRASFGEDRASMYIEVDSDGRPVSTRPRFHRDWAHYTRQAVIDDGLPTDVVAYIREVAHRPHFTPVTAEDVN